MPPAYLVAEIEVTDPGTYARYRALVPQVIAAHGGRFLVLGGAVEVKEGAPPAGRVVVIELDMRLAWPRTSATAGFPAADEPI